MRKQGIGLRAEERVAHLLRSNYKRNVIRCAYGSHYDLIVDGLRVEIKCAAPHKNGPHALEWKFNIHRHGLLNEQETDLYILRLEDLPFSRHAIHMLFKAPLGQYTIEVPIRGLFNQNYAAAVADFYALAKGEYVKKGLAA